MSYWDGYFAHDPHETTSSIHNQDSILKSPFTLRTPFFSVAVLFGCLLSPVLQSESNAQGQSDAKPGKADESESNSVARPPAKLSEKLKTAIGWGEIEVKLKPMVPTEENPGLRWTPKAGTINLSISDKGLSGTLELAEKQAIKVMLEFDNPDIEGGSAQLKIDLDGDSKFGEGEIHKIDPTVRRGNFWYSSPDITVAVNTGKEAAASPSRAYPISLWHVVDPREPNEKPVLRWTRKGWHQGEFNLGNQTCTAVLSDYNLDGLFSDRDKWGIGKSPRDAYSGRNSVYNVAKHAWFDSVAYKVVSVDKNGASLKILSLIHI